MTKEELENLVEENGLDIIYLQKSIPMEFVEDYIEFLDLPYLFFKGYLTHDFIDRYREELEEFTGDGSVNSFLDLQEYILKYFKKEYEIKNYGLPNPVSKQEINKSVTLQIDYEDYEITFSFRNKNITIYFELLRLPNNADRLNTVFTNYKQIKNEIFNEDIFLQTINETLIESKWSLYFDF